MKIDYKVGMLWWQWWWVMMRRRNDDDDDDQWWWWWLTQVRKGQPLLCTIVGDSLLQVSNTFSHCNTLVGFSHFFNIVKISIITSTIPIIRKEIINYNCKRVSTLSRSGQRALAAQEVSSLPWTADGWLVVKSNIININIIKILFVIIKKNILHYWPISRSETGCLGRRTRSRCWWRGRWPGYHHLATTLSSSLSSQVNFEPNHGWKSHPGVQRVLPRSENKVGNPSKLCFHIFSKILSLRYKVIPKKFDQERIYQYYDSDNPEEVKDQSLIIIVVLIVRLTSWRSASRRRSSSTTRSTRVCSRRSPVIVIIMPFIVSAAWQLSFWSTWQWLQWLQVRQKFKKTKKEPKAAAWWGGGATWRC